MLQKSRRKLTASDERVAQFLTWLPWLTLILISIPVPVVFGIKFMTAAASDAAAIYLFLSFVSLGLGLVVGLTLAFLLLLYRRRWHNALRERLASDGITAREVSWFQSELTSEERSNWRRLKSQNLLLADAYCETLAARLNATRISKRVREELLRTKRQLNRNSGVPGSDFEKLRFGLQGDLQRLSILHDEAATGLAAAQLRLQMIEAAANRELSEGETRLMLDRLVSSQTQSPLVLEMAELEQEGRAATTLESTAD